MSPWLMCTRSSMVSCGVRMFGQVIRCLKLCAHVSPSSVYGITVMAILRLVYAMCMGVRLGGSSA